MENYLQMHTMRRKESRQGKKWEREREKIAIYLESMKFIMKIAFESKLKDNFSKYTYSLCSEHIRTKY